MEIKESSIRCPEEGCFQSCLVDDTEKLDLIVNGFIREFCDKNNDFVLHHMILLN